MAEPVKLIDATEVAAILGMSRSWVLQHARGLRRPIIPCVKLGRAVRFRPEDVERFVEEAMRDAQNTEETF